MRIEISTGKPIAERKDYFGSAVNLAARIGAVAKGWQIVVSEQVEASAETVP